MRKFYLFIVLVFMFGFVSMPIISSNYNSIQVVNAAETIATEAQVRLVQERLKAWGYYNGPVTGYYGELTKAAVIKFQKKHGLNPQGYLGPLTLTKIGIYTTTPKGGTEYGSTIITKVQEKLKNWGYYNGPITGYYGELTTKAVVFFQQKNGLKADGYLGPLTLAKIGIPEPSSNTSYQSSTDLNLLAKCVYAEARGEPYAGQVAIAAVVLNRVKSAQFPNSISGVIYQPWAFTVVSDGQINLTPDQTAYKAAQDALNGWDPTYGSVFYYNPATATSEWIFSRPIITRIGNHVFCS
jgi:N-acetylmuramoyl-L-alanine amidase